MGTIMRLARELGAVVIAPNTSMAVALPGKRVEGAGAIPSISAKMQACRHPAHHIHAAPLTHVEWQLVLVKSGMQHYQDVVRSAILTKHNVYS